MYCPAILFIFVIIFSRSVCGFDRSIMSDVVLCVAFELSCVEHRISSSCFIIRISNSSWLFVFIAAILSVS